MAYLKALYENHVALLMTSLVEQYYGEVIKVEDNGVQQFAVAKWNDKLSMVEWFRYYALFYEAVTYEYLKVNF